MATLQKIMFRGSASTSNTLLYTVPSSKEAIVTNIIVSNSTDSDETFSITLDGFPIAKDTNIYGNDVIAFDIRQVLADGDEISAYASSTDITFHISGVEVG